LAVEQRRKIVSVKSICGHLDALMTEFGLVGEDGAASFVIALHEAAGNVRQKMPAIAESGYDPISILSGSLEAAISARLASTEPTIAELNT
jgi:hypothetical protein